MPKTNLGKFQELPPSSTPTVEVGKLRVGRVTAKFTVALELFAKKKYGWKVTSSKKVRDTFKPYGDLIICVYELVKELSILEVKVPYNSPLIWFEKCLDELVAFDFYSLSTVRSSCFSWGDLKKELKSYYAEGDYNFKKLSVDNPFAKRELTALALLVDYAGLASERNYRFERDYWRSFVANIDRVSTFAKKRKDWEDCLVSSTGEVTRKKRAGTPRYLPVLDPDLLLKLCA